MAWLRKPIRGILMDITGVLYESGERKAIEGSTEAVKMLRAANIPFRFITNETQKTREQLDSLLHRLGFDIYEKEIFMCVPAAKKFIHDLNYRPFLLVHPKSITGNTANWSWMLGLLQLLLSLLPRGKPS
ncbi:hypothetical protein V5799_005545 [Amblyomma americanum]|uniref:Phospholysine phosphohistidine inorganic pyrophosphate phosphatase n=1 Tax=Amblyomma americanum TaxID=6943 RepID=A0AAQ4DYY5_AMBAM